MLCLTNQIAEKFCACTLPKPEWTHYAHLRVGLWHLLHHDAEEALLLLRSRIRALNESHGVPNTDTGGYHETITRFYVWRIGKFLEEEGRDRPLDELATRLILRYGDKDLPLEYWSRERLFSAEARREWVQPDKKDL